MSANHAPALLPDCEVHYLGLQKYEVIWDKMKAFTLARTADTPDQLWVLQHYSVFTLGQAGKPGHILDAHAIPIVKSDRGGQVTYHGPGQLVIYLLVDVKRNKFGVRTLVDIIENSIIKVLGSYSIKALTQQGAPGVYVDGKKIAALGLRIKQGCSYHGLSLNIDMDLAPFTYINPCGYEGLETTQLSACLPTSLEDGDQFKKNLYKAVETSLIEELLGHLQYNFSE